jgi:hypothetical protein
VVEEAGIPGENHRPWTSNFISRIVDHHNLYSYRAGELHTFSWLSCITYFKRTGIFNGNIWLDLGI